LDYVAGRYWEEIGKHHVGADTTWRDIARLVKYFGATKLLTEILDDDVAKLVAWRRGHRVTRRGKGRKNAATAPFVANATVNRSTTEVLKKLFTRAKASWGIQFEKEPNWKQHWLKEPQERVRELHGGEADQLDDATRDDYRPIMEFTGVSGLRMNECLLRWSEVNWDARKIEKQGKGDKRVAVPITDAIREILWPLRGHHSEMVFTYIAKRTRKPQKLVKGERPPDHLQRPQIGVETHQGDRQGHGLPLSRLPPRLRNQAAAGNRQHEAGAEGAEPCRHQDHRQVCPRPRRRSRRWHGCSSKVPKEVPKAD
jgi:hypothetical protein